MGDKTSLTEAQHLTMSELDYPQDHNLGQAEADYLLPLTSEELSTLNMALALFEERAHSEGDQSSKESACKMYNRVKYDGLIESL